MLSLSYFSLLSCSTTSIVEVLPTEAAISVQEKTLRSVYIGQSRDETLKRVGLSTGRSFDILEKGRYFSYQEFMNFDTNILLGFYFEDEVLASVISEDDASKLFACRTFFKTGNTHWLNFGIQPYSDWIKARNSLSNEFNYRAYKPRKELKRNRVDTALEKTVTALVYAPLAIATSPVILHDTLSETTNQERAKTHGLIQLSHTIKINDTEQHVYSTLGKPDKISYVNRSKVLSYFTPSYSYGIVDGTVTWKETYSMFELYERQKKHGKRTYGDNDCGELERLWESNNSLKK